MNKIKENLIALILLGIFTIFIIYGTTIPFRFTGLGSASTKIGTIAWRPLFTFTGERVSISDIVQNIMLFMPIGFLWGVFFLRIQKIKRGFFLGTLYGTLLSAAVETFQLFTDDRVVSITDVISNTLGTAAGYAGALIAVFMILGLIEAPKVRKFLECDGLFPFLFVCSIVIAEIWQPFDFSLDVGGIFPKIKMLFRDPLQWSSTMYREPVILLFYMILSSSVIGINKCSPIKIPVLRLISMMFLFVCIIESIQFAIMSRAPGGADILVGFAGILSGFLFYKFSNQKQILIIEFMSLFCVFSKFFSPFKLRSQYQEINWIPFLSEYTQTTMVSLGNVIELTVLFCFIGYYSYQYFSNRAVRLFLIVFWGCVIILFEFLQGFIIGRYPDISDVFIAFTALLAGGFIKIKIEPQLENSIKELLCESAQKKGVKVSI